jgi:LacI family transcriptional regulator
MSNLRRVAISLELEWPYARHVNIFSGTQRYAQECGRWECVIDEFAYESMRGSTKKKPVYDGIIARVSSQLAEEVRRCRVPTVNVWYNSPVVGLPRVFPDFTEVGKLAAEHLLGLGLRRFGCMSPIGDQADALEIDSYHAVLRDAGCHCECVRVPINYISELNGWKRFQTIMRQWMAKWQPPMGVYVSNTGVTARSVVTECHKRGLRVPEDVALIAGLIEPILCLNPAPSLTTVAIPYEEIGYQAARMLDQLMDGSRAPSAPLLIKPAGVLARQSTNCLAVDDETVAAALHYLLANSHREISIDHLAKAAHSSRRTLERKFTAVLGRSIASEIRRLRVECAKRHLADPNIRVKQAAVMSGFANEQRLYEAFLQQEGISPSQYRAERGVLRWQPKS